MARGFDGETFKNIFSRRRRSREDHGIGFVPGDPAAIKVAKETLNYIKKEGFQPQDVGFYLCPDASRPHGDRYNLFNLQRFLDNPLSVNDVNPTIEGRTYGFKAQNTAISPVFEIGGFEIKELGNGYKLLQISVYQEDEGEYEYHDSETRQGRFWISSNSEHAFLLSPQGEITERWDRSIGPKKKDRSKMRERILAGAQKIINA